MGIIIKVDISIQKAEGYNIIIEPDFSGLSKALSDIFASADKFMLVFDSNTEIIIKRFFCKMWVVLERRCIHLHLRQVKKVKIF